VTTGYWSAFVGFRNKTIDNLTLTNDQSLDMGADSTSLPASKRWPK
jgi:hypothetical protein